jgi:2-methylaconitate cis-trans-isomerase PrpF
VFFRAEDLPSDSEERQSAILRVFGGEAGLLADGLGGANPVLRKVAIVSPGPPMEEGAGSLEYVFGQVNHDLTRVEHINECGNTAAGVPLFGSLFGWCPSPESRGKVFLNLANTGKRVAAEWIHGDSLGGSLRLSFLDPVGPTASAALPLEEPESIVELGGGRRARLSVIQALNSYVFVDSYDLGIADLGASDSVGPTVYEMLNDIALFVRERLRDGESLKLCLVAQANRSGAVQARIVYPTERCIHPSFAVTGATTLAVASRIEGTVVQRLVRSAEGSPGITIDHASGDFPVSWNLREDGLPERVSIERTCRLIIRGSAY